MNNTKFLLDSGDPNEYREIAALAKKHGEELWGATTNPTLIAKKLSGKKVSQKEAFELQKEIVLEILNLVKGAVSAEVYADENTTAEEMVAQGREIAIWHERIFVKLPTTIEGFKARTILRREKIPVNNTLVFSQQQVFAICLHEKILQKEVSGLDLQEWPAFISPFVGRLDDIGQDGMSLVENVLKMKKEYNFTPWILAASVRRAEHIKRGIDAGIEIITVPGHVYKEWFSLSNEQKNALDNRVYANFLQPIPSWTPSEELLSIASSDEFMDVLASGILPISHELTNKGIARFATDWKQIISAQDSSQARRAYKSPKI